MAAASRSSGLGGAERWVLAEMPLHAITSVHGEPVFGSGWLSRLRASRPTDQDRMHRALAPASRVHVADRRRERLWRRRTARLRNVPKGHSAGR